MIFIIGFTILFGYQVFRWGLTDWFIDTLAIAVLSFFGFLVGSGVACIFDGDTETKKIRYNIVSLQDGDAITADLFLGSGIIDEEMKYMFYYNDNGAHKFKSVDHDKANIYYTEQEPVVVEYRTDQIRNWKVLYAMDLPYSRYEIKIPKGTIKNNYTLDAK